MVINISKTVLIFSYILCTSVCISVQAQTVFQGIITDNELKVLPDVYVVLSSVSDSTMLQYTSSDKNGCYKITYNGTEKELLLYISNLGLKKQFKRIDNQSQKINFMAEQESILLKEVTVQADKIKATGDTINYLVSAFQGKNDIVIADVLKKMPGINVSKDGKINFNGKAVSELYIENMNLLGGRYGIATNNVSASDVASVQVMQNFQPIKALAKHQLTDNVVINLKIKENRKAIFTSTAVAGIGYSKSDLLRHAELNGMYFGRGHQNISIYKTDNMGNNLSKDLTLFNGTNQFNLSPMSGMSIPTPPDISQRNYLFNNDHSATINNIKSLKNEATLKINLFYYHQEDSRHEYSRTENWLQGDSIRRIIEDLTGKSKDNEFNGEIVYEQNKPTGFLKNNLSFTGSWDNGNALAITPDNAIGQNMKTNRLGATNATQFIRNFQNGRGINLSSVNKMAIMPHHLSISPGLYPNLFNDSIPYQLLRQNVDLLGFNSQNSISLLSALNIHGLRISPKVSLNVTYYSMKSDFNLTQEDATHTIVPGEEMQNNIKWIQIVPSVGLWAEYTKNNFNAATSLSAKYEYSSMNNTIRQQTQNLRKPYFNPYIQVTYKITPDLNISTNHSINTSSAGFGAMYSGYILTNYRNLNRFDTHFYENKNYDGYLKLSYQNLPLMLFASCGTSWRKSKSDVMFGQTMGEFLTTTQVYDQENKNRNFSINGEISKSFDWKQSIISFKASYGKYNGQQLRQDELIDYHTNWLYLEYSIGINPFPWLQFEINGEGHRSHGKISTGEKINPIWNLSNKGNLTFNLIENVSLLTECENFYNDAIGEKKSFTLANMGLVLTHNNIRYSLDWNNIFNLSKFVNEYNTGIDQYRSEYYIRPTYIAFSVRFRIK